MSTLNITKVKALKEEQQCWGCGDKLLKGTSATLHMESERIKGEKMGSKVTKSYWCDCCVAFSEKFGKAYGSIEEFELKENPLYKRFRSDWEKENKKTE